MIKSQKVCKLVRDKYDKKSNIKGYQLASYQIDSEDRIKALLINKTFAIYIYIANRIQYHPYIFRPAILYVLLIDYG